MLPQISVSPGGRLVLRIRVPQSGNLPVYELDPLRSHYPSSVDFSFSEILVDNLSLMAYGLASSYITQEFGVVLCKEQSAMTKSRIDILRSRRTML